VDIFDLYDRRKDLSDSISMYFDGDEDGMVNYCDRGYQDLLKKFDDLETEITQAELNEVSENLEN
jgi:hypothetical protein